MSSHLQDAMSIRSGRSHLTVDLDAVAANWGFFAENADGAECAAVIKANGYGLGLAPVAKRLARAGCKTFFVAHLEEGQAARAALGPEATIYVLNGIMPGEEVLFFDNDLRPVLNTLSQIDLWRETALFKPAALHVDTGMNRLGLSEEDLDAASQALEGVSLSLIMSHLACASDPHHPKNQMQLDLFKSIVPRLPPAPLSLAASAGTLLQGDYCFDMVRPGIGLYGGAPFDRDHVALAPSVKLEAPIIQLRMVGPGDHSGYGATWQADRRRRLAIVALGYADGFLRSGSGRGFAVVGGAVCPIVGRVSMDLIALDVTNASPSLKEGAMAQFLGPAAPIDAQAEALGTIAYELLTGLGDRAARTYIGADED
jgi:alanine racemase